jgi:branched-subunit amino acid aminotransferase/4-amino-4-deoxychorismate lyase
VNLNGVLVDAGEARLSVFDHGLLYGLGVFETVRGYGGQVFRLGAHLARLRAGAAILRLEVPWPDAELERAVAETLAANEAPDGIARLTVTGGVGMGSRGAGEQGGAPSYFVFVRDRQPPALLGGYAVDFASYQVDSRSPLAGVKSLNFAVPILARQEARAGGFDEALMVNERGELVEASMANVFLVSGGRLLTPPLTAGCLPGITRAAILEVAAIAGIPATETPVPAGAIADAGEIFLTNSAIEVMPVLRVGATPVGDGQVGPVTRRLATAYRELVARETGS